MRIRAGFVILLLAVAAFVAAAPALAFTEGESEGDTEVVEEDQGSELGIEPAVEAPPVAEDEPDRPWTQRFLAPTVLALGVVGLLGSIAYYGMRVRGKYRVVE